MKKTIMLCLGLLVVAGANAQNRRVELDLQKAIEIALDENPTIKIAGLEIERQNYVKKETKGNFLPSLAGEGTYTYAVKQATMGGLPMGSDHSVSLSGSLGLPLFVPALFQTLKLNDEQMRAAVEAARSSKINLVNEVKKSYYQILFAEESLKVLKTSEASISETVEDTRIKFQNEMASEYDLITAEVQLSNLQPTIFETQNGINVAKKMMKMLLNMPEDVEIVIVEDFNDLATTNILDANFTKDFADNSDLRSLEIQQSILERQLKLAKTSRMPSLSAFGNYTASGQDQISNFGEVMAGLPKKTEFKWQHPINVGARLSIPIFAGRTNTMKEKQLKNNIQQMDYQKYYLEQSLKVQVENAINAIRTAREKMNANQKTIAQAQKGYDISKVRYEQGMGTILELNSSELALTQAKLNYTQAIYDYLSAQADYEKVIGKEN